MGLPFLRLCVIRPHLRATAKSLDKVKRSLLLLGNMAAKMSVNRPEEEKRDIQKRFNTRKLVSGLRPDGIT